jgi:hypothetical protein
MIIDTIDDHCTVVSLPPFLCPIVEKQVGKEIQLDGNCKMEIVHEGICCDLFWYDHQWKFSCDQDESKWESSIANELTENICEKFWLIWNEKQMILPDEQYHRKSFHFVMDVTDDIILFAVRDLETFLEDDPTIYEQLFKWKLPTPFVFHVERGMSFIELQHEMKKRLDVVKHSGVIIRDAFFRRVKVELPIHTFIKKLKSQGLNPLKQTHISPGTDANMVEILRRCSSEDDIAMARQTIERVNPDFTDYFIEQAKQFSRMCEYLDEWKRENLTGNDAVDSEIIKHKQPLSSIFMFKMMRTNANARTVIADPVIKTFTLSTALKRFGELNL